MDDVLEGMKKPVAEMKKGDPNLRLDDVTGTLVEYDTTINQMLVLLSRWGIPTDHPLHAKVIQVGETEYDYRAAARGA